MHEMEGPRPVFAVQDGQSPGRMRRVTCPPGPAAERGPMTCLKNRFPGPSGAAG